MTSKAVLAHQALLDFVNLFPLMSPEVRDESTFFTVDPRWRTIMEPWRSRSIPGTFDDFLDRHFPKAEFPEFRAYLEHGDPRFPQASPIGRWSFIAAMSHAMRIWASYPHEKDEVAPWSFGDRKPEGICPICGKLYLLIRKDRPACPGRCGNTYRQRERRKLKESGMTKTYNEARKKKRAKESGSKKGAKTR